MTMSSFDRQVTLHEAVRELAGKGVSSPNEILAQLSERYGQHWVLRQFLNEIAKIAMPTSRPDIGPRAEVVRVPGVPRVRRAAGDADVFSGSVWVMGQGWVPLGDLTPADCRTVAEQYGRLMEAAGRHRDWYLAAADVAEREGAETLGEVRGLLPAPLARLELTDATEAV